MDKLYNGKEHKALKKIDEIDRLRDVANETLYFKPCPWCGTKPEVVGTHAATDWVECPKCGAKGPDSDYKNWKQSAKKAVDRWNSYGLDLN